MNASLPPNEPGRLQALRDYDILDTPHEVAFDCLTHLAAQLFEMPVVTISLIDANRQWFKACFGIDRRDTPRETSFCAHAILSDEIMVIPDAARDPRFRDNPLVTGANPIRFYAGAPLKTPNGHNLGTFCVIDSVPREFNATQQALLVDLAALVVDELELRRVARELLNRQVALQQSEEQFRQFAEHINDIFWMIRPDSLELIYISPAYETIWGRSREELATSPFAMMQYVHSEDREQLQQMLALATEHNGATFEGEFRIIRPDGDIRWIHARGFPILNSYGQVYRVAGISEDISYYKQAELALHQAKAIVEQANEILEQSVDERTAQLADSQVEILTRLARAAEFRDDDTGKHTQRVAHTSALLAQALGLSNEHVMLIKQAAPLHDVGKIAISDLILLKPGKLTDEEFATMKTHAAMGAALLADGQSEVVHMAERIAGCHHERWDGRGYPQQLTGEQIPLEACILAVADVFDALTHERPYKKAWTVEAAAQEIARQSGQQFRPQVVEAFLRLSHQDLV